ncbi:unnamed protein product [Prunus armeniaca]
MKQAAVHAKAEYFNSKPGPSARKEESATKSYPGQTDDLLAGHKRKDDRDCRQGNSKKGRESTVVKTTELPYRITIVLRKSSPR